MWPQEEPWAQRQKLWSASGSATGQLSPSNRILNTLRARSWAGQGISDPGVATHKEGLSPGVSTKNGEQDLLPELLGSPNSAHQRGRGPATCPAPSTHLARIFTDNTTQPWLFCGPETLWGKSPEDRVWKRGAILAYPQPGDVRQLPWPWFFLLMMGASAPQQSNESGVDDP